jgi:hypothetical protein
MDESQESLYIFPLMGFEDLKCTKWKDVQLYQAGLSLIQTGFKLVYC